MITRVAISGFKSLLSIPLEMRRLTVLLGGNGSGKSSAIQSLLLLRQSCDSAGVVYDLKLSGALFEAGTAVDVMHPSANTDERSRRILDITIANVIANGVYDDEIAYRFRYERESGEDERVLKSFDGRGTGLRPPLQPISDKDTFGYLSAERVGPRVSYPMPSTKPLAGPIGKNGEFTAAYLAGSSKSGRAVQPLLKTKLMEARENLKQTSVTEAPIFGESTSKTVSDLRLNTVANEALSWAIPGASFEVEEHGSMDTTQLGFHRINLVDRKLERPTHIGFGLSYSLPVIVGALAIDRDGLFIVENAESHLHPLSQSRMGTFLAIASVYGPQTLIETHSDHLVNGIRLAVKYGLIQPDQVIFHYFDKAIDRESTRVTPIELEPDGNLRNWPPGFMDQIANDLSRL